MIIIIDHHDHRPDHVMLEPGPLDNSNKVSDGARKGHRGPKIHTLEHLFGNTINHPNHYKTH